MAGKLLASTAHAKIIPLTNCRDIMLAFCSLFFVFCLRISYISSKIMDTGLGLGCKHSCSINYSGPEARYPGGMPMLIAYEH
jgi:hypothetical protein